MKGMLITFEGSEGSGKSTQLSLLHEVLVKRGRDVTLLREPGGVVISEKIRDILLDVRNDEMSPACETLLYLAARAQLVEEVMRPLLDKGSVVLCDRFMDSTVVYQGCGHGISLDTIQQLGEFATKGLGPDLTFLFDVEASTGLARLNRDKDRIELRNEDYHNRVREGYLTLARADPGRIVVIDANDQSISDIHAVVLSRVEALLESRQIKTS